MQNDDLVWGLDKFERRQAVQDFVLGFENKLCVFSPSVSQLYTNYDIFFPKEENRKLVILPNPYASHDTFNQIESCAVKPTGLFIIPGNAQENRGQLNMILPFKGDKSGHKTVPLEVALKFINAKRPPNKPFLPILTKGDLRELNRKTPCLHLHSLNCSQLAMLSELEIGDIERVICSRLQDLAARR